MRIHLANALITILLLITPAALAAPITGSLRFDEGAQLDGALNARASRGLVDLAKADGALFSWNEASGYVVTHTRSQSNWGPEVRSMFQASKPDNESVDLAPLTDARLACEDRCVAVLLAEDGGEIAWLGAAPAEVAWATQTKHFVWTAQGEGVPDAFDERVEKGWISLPTSHVSASGALRLVLANATLTAPDGRVVLDTRTRVEEDPGPLGLAGARRVVLSFAVLQFEGAALRAAEAPFWASAPTFALDGELSAPKARGTIANRVVEDQPVVARGSLLWAFETEPGLLATPLLGRVSGDASFVSIDGQSVELANSLAPASVVIAATGVGTLLVLVAFVLYTRLNRDTLLRNPNRQRVLDVILAHPGEHVAGIVRAAGMPEVVVRHHLRILEQHGLVTMRPAGKLRTYHVPGLGVAADKLSSFVLLKDETRRTLLETLTQSGAALSQKEIALRSGASQRLVSYHLQILEKESLVVSAGTMPRRYRAAAQLSDPASPDSETAPLA